ncbi:MAG: energy transducer TonB [Deefgea sp.]
MLKNKSSHLRGALLCALLLHAFVAWAWNGLTSRKLTPPASSALAVMLQVMPAAVNKPAPKAPAKLDPRSLQHNKPQPQIAPKLMTQPISSVSEPLAKVLPKDSTAQTPKELDLKPSAVNYSADAVKPMLKDAGEGQAEAKIIPAQYRPAYLQNPEPVMPLISRKNNEFGVVGLRVKVSTKGEPLWVNVDKSSGFPRLDQVASKTVKDSWRFVPAKKGETPIESEVVFNIPFVLKDAD